MPVSELRLQRAHDAMLRDRASLGEAMSDDFDGAFVVSAGTRRMMLVTSLVGAGIWTVILQIIF